MAHLNILGRASIALVITLLLVPSFAFAQQTLSVQISPTTIEERIEPGTTRDYTLTVVNKGDVSVELYPLARNITGMGPDSRPIYSLETGDQSTELASWITYKETSISLLPNETKSMNFTITFPLDAHPGAHMGGVFLADQPRDEIKNGSAIGFEIGTILSFQVAGEIVENTQIREFYTSKTVYSSPDVDFTIRLENLGNVLSKPHGLIDITNMFGRKVATLPVNESAAGVFPKGKREFLAKWAPEDFQFGRYEAVVALAVEGIGGTQTIDRVVQFWILPMDILMPVLGGLFVLILLIYVLLRIYIKRQLSGVRSSRGGTRNTGGLSRLAVVVIALLVAIIIGLFILFFYLG